MGKHFNFGVQRSGKCFILGNILIIGHWSHEESGYLQLEFSEQLQKLPVWNKTHYYCFASELLDVSTGQSLTNDFLERYIDADPQHWFKTPHEYESGNVQAWEISNCCHRPR